MGEEKGGREDAEDERVLKAAGILQKKVERLAMPSGFMVLDL